MRTPIPFAAGAALLMVILPCASAEESAPVTKKIDAPEEKVAPPGQPLPSAKKGLPDAPLAPQAETDECGWEGLQIDDAQRAGLKEGIKPRTSFRLRFQGEESPFAVISTAVMPGEDLALEIVAGEGEPRFHVKSDGGELVNTGARQWRWKAPKEPGLFCVHVTNPSTDEHACLHVFVKRPYDGRRVLNGYEIGEYQKLPLKGDPAYRVPDGLIEVTKENEETWLSPHFQLRQFVGKQKAAYPRYVLVNTRLLLKLEHLLEQVRAKGIPTRSFYVVSAYRTPFYNKAIGNKTAYSRHSYGDAADILIIRESEPRHVDPMAVARKEDAKQLHSLVDELHRQEWFSHYIGGLGFYAAKPQRPAFIHVDTRGKPVRW